jgi:hypothetical protein
MVSFGHVSVTLSNGWGIKKVCRKTLHTILRQLLKIGVTILAYLQLSKLPFRSRSRIYLFQPWNEDLAFAPRMNDTS